MHPIVIGCTLRRLVAKIAGQRVIDSESTEIRIFDIILHSLSLIMQQFVNNTNGY